jgi:hypothetical protein
MSNMFDGDTNSKRNLKKCPAAEVRLEEQKGVKRSVAENISKANS